MEITRVPDKQCKSCNIGTLRDVSVDGAKELTYRCDWCSAVVTEEIPKAIK